MGQRAERFVLKESGNQYCAKVRFTPLRVPQLGRIEIMPRNTSKRVSKLREPPNIEQYAMWRQVRHNLIGTYPNRLHVSPVVGAGKERRALIGPRDYLNRNIPFIELP